MSTPQLENGFVRIATEIIEALMAYRLPGEQMQCLLVIIRKTYGFNKKMDMISNSQFVGATGMAKPSICRAINGLVDKNIVYKNANNYIPSYQFNKNYKTWKVLTKKLTVNKKVNQVLTKKLPTIDITTKDKEIVPYKKIIFYLNEKSKKNFKYNTISTKKFIKARWNDGFMLADFFKVIDNQCREWLKDSKMNQYLRPGTLFSNKFDGYLQNKAVPKQKKPGAF